MDLNTLSPEERKALVAQVKEADKLHKQKVRNNQDAYKALVDAGVKEAFTSIREASEILSKLKEMVYDNLAAALKMKMELYGIADDDQQTHTFTTSDGQKSITIGYRTIDRYDDTVTAGKKLVREYIESLASNEETARLVTIITNLMKPDKDGNMKSSRVMELKKLADEMELGSVVIEKEQRFIDGVNIIINAYRPERTKKFVEAYEKDENGVQKGVPLSISTV